MTDTTNTAAALPAATPRPIDFAAIREAFGRRCHGANRHKAPWLPVLAAPPQGDRT